jgi:hypothetical protein
MTPTKPITDAALTELDQRAELSFSGLDISTADYFAIRERLRLAEQERDENGTILKRLTDACYPIDMWLGGAWTRPLSGEERRGFVLALSDAYRQATGSKT